MKQQKRPTYLPGVGKRLMVQNSDSPVDILVNLGFYCNRVSYMSGGAGFLQQDVRWCYDLPRNEQQSPLKIGRASMQEETFCCFCWGPACDPSITLFLL